MDDEIFPDISNHVNTSSNPLGIRVMGFETEESDDEMMEGCNENGRISLPRINVPDDPDKWFLPCDVPSNKNSQTVEKAPDKPVCISDLLKNYNTNNMKFPFIPCNCNHAELTTHTGFKHDSLQILTKRNPFPFDSTTAAKLGYGVTEYIDVSPYFNKKQADAAKDLKVSESSFSKAWNLGTGKTRRWPFRSLRILDRQIAVIRCNSYKCTAMENRLDELVRARNYVARSAIIAIKRFIPYSASNRNDIIVKSVQSNIVQ